MKAYNAAMAKRSELTGSRFDLWAFEEASTPSTSHTPSVDWALSSSTGTYRKTLGRVQLAMSVSCYERLRQRYVGPVDRFAGHLDALALRYAPLHKGLQAACPDAVFVILKELWEVDTECFASPFNCRLSRFCSAFPEVDSPFGSLGSFFDYHPVQGSFEVNPPFIEEIIAKAHVHMEKLLKDSKGPLMFIVIVPRWQGKKCWQHLSESKWVTRSTRLKLEDHQFSRGEVSARNGEELDATNETSVFFMQNELAKQKWLIDDRSIHKLKVAFGSVAKTQKKVPKQLATTTGPSPTPPRLAPSSGKSNWEKLQSATKKGKK